jgi:hypothetical protein
VQVPTGTQGENLITEIGLKLQSLHRSLNEMARYARTQEHLGKNPNLLAKYIREGNPWLENKDSSSFKPEYVKSFYTALWGTTPDINIPFTVTGSGHKALDIGEVFQAITARDINECLNHVTQNSDAWAGY